MTRLRFAICYPGVKGCFSELRDSCSMPVMCNDCSHDFIADLPAALIVLVPKDPELSLVGGCLCRRCLVREDVLEVVADHLRPDCSLARTRSRSVDAVLSWPCWSINLVVCLPPGGRKTPRCLYGGCWRAIEKASLGRETSARLAPTSPVTSRRQAESSWVAAAILRRLPACASTSAWHRTCNFSHRQSVVEPQQVRGFERPGHSRILRLVLVAVPPITRPIR